MRRSRLSSNDDGSASLEFITVGMILLVPLVYLVVALSQLQAGAFAVEGAARQAARVFVQSPTIGDATASAKRAVDFALADYGLESSATKVSISCRPRPGTCLTRQGSVSVTVTTRIVLPLVPPVLDLSVPLSVPMNATATQQVSRFWSSQ